MRVGAPGPGSSLTVRGRAWRGPQGEPLVARLLGNGEGAAPSCSPGRRRQQTGEENRARGLTSVSSAPKGPWPRLSVLLRCLAWRGTR